MLWLVFSLCTKILGWIQLKAEEKSVKSSRTAHLTVSACDNAIFSEVLMASSNPCWHLKANWTGSKSDSTHKFKLEGYFMRMKVIFMERQLTPVLLIHMNREGFVSPNSSVDDLHHTLIDALTDVDQWSSTFSHPAQQKTCSKWNGHIYSPNKHKCLCFNFRTNLRHKKKPPIMKDIPTSAANLSEMVGFWGPLPQNMETCSDFFFFTKADILQILQRYRTKDSCPYLQLCQISMFTKLKEAEFSVTNLSS